MKNKPPLDGLYLLTDAELCRENGMLPGVAAALRGGVCLVQYRDKSDDHERRRKEARALVELCHDANARLIVNDDVELAFEVAADGVHLGQDDEDIARAREKLGDDAIIGVSCYNAFSRAVAAERSGANYVAFGSVFPSPIKPDAPRAPLHLLQQAREELDIPVCAIGGINADNIGKVAATGVHLFAVISALLTARNPEDTARDLLRRVSAARN
jgi:thiamine-phosphate pyrophosphorylase